MKHAQVRIPCPRCGEHNIFINYRIRMYFDTSCSFCYEPFTLRFTDDADPHLASVVEQTMDGQ